jgi:hypothetical protein
MSPEQLDAIGKMQDAGRKAWWRNFQLFVLQKPRPDFSPAQIFMI